MAKSTRRKPARRPRRLDKQYYRIAVQAYDLDCSFGLQLMRARADPYWESADAIVHGEFLGYDYKGINRVELRVSAWPDLDDIEARMRAKPTAVGLLHVEDGRLRGWVSAPSRILPTAVSILSSGRPCWIGLEATEMIRREMTIYRFSITTEAPTDDDASAQA